MPASAVRTDPAVMRRIPGSSVRTMRAAVRLPILASCAVFGSRSVGILLAASAVAGGLAVYGQVGWLEWFFLAVMLARWALSPAGVRAWRQAVVERQRVVRVSSTEPLAVARPRFARSGDGSARTLRCLRKTLLAVEAEAATALNAPEPVPGIQRIRQHTQVATTELRRQLGLLRTPESGSTDAASPPAGGQHDLGARRPHTRCAGGALGGIESLVYPRMDGVELSWMSTLLTIAAASTIIGRTVAPGTAAFACGALFLIGVLLGAPVEGGFWVLITVGGLLWTIASRVGTRGGTWQAGCSWRSAARRNLAVSRDNVNRGCSWRVWRFAAVWSSGWRGAWRGRPVRRLTTARPSCARPPRSR